MFHFAEEFPSRITQPIQNYMHAGYNGFRPGINYTGNSISCVSELLFFCNFFLEACFYRGAPSIFFSRNQKFCEHREDFLRVSSLFDMPETFFEKTSSFFLSFPFFFGVFCCTRWFSAVSSWGKIVFKPFAYPFVYFLALQK